jgi:hypothetical protein
MNYELLGDIILRENGINPPTRLELDYGAIIGKVEVIDCVRFHPSKWFFGPWGWVLTNPIHYKKFIPMKGRLGIFNVPAVIEFLESV